MFKLSFIKLLLKKYWFWFGFSFLVLYLVNLFVNIEWWVATLFLIGVFFIFPLVRLIIHKEEFLPFVRELERIMFSKPLDKEFWNKGELKTIKPKLVLRKKKKIKRRNKRKC